MIANISGKPVSARDCQINNGVAKINHDEDFDQKLRHAEDKESGTDAQNPPQITSNHQAPIQYKERVAREKGESNDALPKEAGTHTKRSLTTEIAEESVPTLPDEAPKMPFVQKHASHGNILDPQLFVKDSQINNETEQGTQTSIPDQIENLLAALTKNSPNNNQGIENTNLQKIADIKNAAAQSLAQLPHIIKMKITGKRNAEGENPLKEGTSQEKSSEIFSEAKNTIQKDGKAAQNEGRFDFKGQGENPGKSSSNHTESSEIPKSDKHVIPVEDKNSASFRHTNNIFVHDVKIGVDKIQPASGNNVKITRTYQIDLAEFESRTTQLAKNLAGESSSQAKLVIKPPALGTVFVDLSLENNNLKVMIQADNKETLKNIENQIGSLRDKLIQNGFKPEIDEVKFKDSGRDLNNFNQNNFSDSFAHREPRQSRRDLMQSFRLNMKRIEAMMENNE